MKAQKILLILASMILFSAPLKADGYQWFHNFQVSSEAIEALCTDPSGRVWLGSKKGMFRLGDFPEDDLFFETVPEVMQQGIDHISPFGKKYFFVRASNGATFIYDPIRNVTDSLSTIIREWKMDIMDRWEFRTQTDSDGVIWCYSDSVLYRKDPAAMHADEVLSLPEPITAFCAGPDGFSILSSSLLSIYSRKDNSLILSTEFKYISDSHSARLAMDKEGNVWIGENGRLSRLDRATGRIDVVYNNAPVTDILASKSGDIIVSTSRIGILRFDTKGTLLQTITHKPHDLNSLYSNNVAFIIESEDKTLWVCYEKQVISASHPDEIPFPTRHIPQLKRDGQEESILAIAQDRSGNIWLGTDNYGLFRMDARTGDFHADDLTGPSEIVTSVFIDSRDRVWAGTYRNGIWCRDGRTVHHFLEGKSCYGFQEDANGNVWVGMMGSGVYRFDAELRKAPQPVHGIEGKFAIQLAGSKTGTVYAATANGLYFINEQTLECSLMSGNIKGTQTFSYKHYESACLDTRGLLWTTSNNSDGLIEIYDTKRDAIVDFQLPVARLLKSVIEDENGTIWLTSDSEIIQVIVNYEPSTEKYSFHPSFWLIRMEGSTKNYHNYRTSTLLNDGTLLFGCSDGFQQISPNSFPPYSPRPTSHKILIASVKVNNKYLKALSFGEGISLPHDQNNISLHLEVQDYTSPFETALHYRIVNETEWTPVHGNSIELSGLRPGEYNLEITSDVINDQPVDGSVVPFCIKIESPWYSTIWARLAYALIFSLLIFLLAYIFIARQRQQMYLEQVRKESERQYQLNEVKLRFFTNISHDFRTPLSLIITPLESHLNSGDGKPIDDSVLKLIHRNAVRLLNLINQILDFRKLEANAATLNMNYGDIVAFSKEICSSFLLFTEGTSKKLRFESPLNDLNMFFDKDKCTKILMNLLSNAFKYTSADGEIVVSVNSEDGQAILSVADDGPGVPDEEKEAIFERFHQIATNAATHTGTGIGLHIIKEFVTLQNGTVKVTDNEPHGSIFTIRIPIVSEGPVAVEDNTPAPEETCPEQVTDGRKHLLLVEDDMEFRQFLQDQLSANYTVHTAVNGKDALGVLENNEIDIILSDVMMEEMDGLELCKRVKTNLDTSHIPLILLTAKAMAEDEIRGFEIGADDYVTKPFNMEVLRHRIRLLLEEHVKSQKKFREKLDVTPSEITITPLDEQFLSKAIQLVEEHMEDPEFSVETLSSLLGVHRTSLYKKITSLTEQTPIEFIRIIRLKRAAQYLTKSQLYVYEVGDKVGFNSPKVFTKYFKDEFGMSPREYQKLHGTGEINNSLTDN